MATRLQDKTKTAGTIVPAVYIIDGGIKMDSFFGWIGGKKLLRKAIVERFPGEFSRYIEVFGGAGWVLFYKDKHAPLEVYNDKNGDLVNLFRCVKEHAPEMQRLMQLELNSRQTFDEYLYLMRNNPFQTDIQRAIKFLLVIKTSFGSKGTTFGCASKSISNMTKCLEGVQERLKNVVIEHCDFERLIAIYDRADALFYLDPPYYKTEKYYAVEFAKEDHLRLRDALSLIKGKFLLSYNDDPYVKELYSGFKIEEVTRNNSLANKVTSNAEYKELIITNY